MTRELTYVTRGRLEWRERADPQLQAPTDVLVRPFVAGRCDGDVLPLHHSVSRPMQAGVKLHLIDPVIADITGAVPFHGPFGIGHECIAQVTATGDEVRDLRVGDAVVVPWSVSCGDCRECRRGITAKCSTARALSPGKALAAFGFGPSCGAWGGVVTDSLRVPFADRMLVRLPDGLDPLRVAAAADNLSDAWRSVAPPLDGTPDASVLVIGGGSRSIGLYAAGLAVALGAARVDYVDDDPDRLAIAEGLGAAVLEVSRRRWTSVSPAIGTTYDVAVEASSTEQGLRDALRALGPGGVCTATGYYVGTGTRVPVMDMYATSATLHAGVSNVRPRLPELLDFVARTGFAAEQVTSTLLPWEDAPAGYAARTTKLVLHREPLDLSA
ncbi:zinc-dependent alcohol dehydrogenase [Flexivirga oryzae]|uniref:Alcohol dehydrogenase n=1 Tax=Flexivirga oryzae TaxID=1794944 RepID=A0A839N683_9MICO|nr:alcohol dehydrogenase catalytic domain-containing protein [Flexivirga oryzae]MBB2892279.1 alcohol dehydrogenase [Flexivirga oryzae]